MRDDPLSPVWRCVAAAAAVCVLASSVYAQASRTVRGTVLDPSDHPIGGAAILAVGGLAAISDDSGRFRLEIPHRNRIVFDARRVGFMPSRSGLDAGGDTTFTILMLPVAQSLEAVKVQSAETHAPAIAGFEERARARKSGAGLGYFMTERDIEPLNAVRVTQLLETIPSIIVKRVGGDRYALFGKTTGGADCAATLFLDGIRLGGGDPAVERRGRVPGQPGSSAPVDQYVNPSELAGIEVYPRGMLAPPQFQPMNDYTATKCAIVLFWTKHR